MTVACPRPAPRFVCVSLLALPLVAQQPGWTRQQTFCIRGRPTLAWDDQRGVHLAYQGNAGVFGIDETWELRGGAWLRRAGIGRSMFAVEAMVHDSWQHETIMHGVDYTGPSGPITPITVIARAGRWSVHAGPEPDVQSAPLAFDSGRGRVVMFGGRSSLGSLSAATWEWDGLAWQQRQPNASPAARLYPSMAFDPSRGRVVMFSGSGSTGVLADTWEWDGVNWTQMTTATAPPGRLDAAMVFDPRSQGVLLAGGRVAAPLDDTWLWNGTSWQQLAATGFGGQVGGACTDGRDALALIVTDHARRQLQRWTGSTWQPVDLISPVPDGAVAAAPGGGVLRWGGQTPGSVFAEGSRWDGVAWQPVAAFGPPPRRGHCMAFDLLRQRVVLFGGVGPAAVFNDTWEWDGAQWFQVATSGPDPRWTAALVYDAGRGRSVLVGGEIAPLLVQPPGTTWEWDGAQWSSVPPAPGAGAIHARSRPAAAFDFQTFRVVLFGGSTATPFQDTWFYDGTTWTAGPLAPPTQVDAPTLGFEPLRGRLLLVGLGPTGTPLAFELTNGWRPVLAPAGDPALGTPVAVYDSQRGRLAVFSGDSYVEELSRTVPAVAVSGPGCQATIAPQLDAVGQPLLGTTVWLDATDTGNTFVALVLATTAGNLTIGGCTLVPALGQFAEVRPTPTGVATFALRVPRAAVLQGMQVHGQMVAPDATAAQGLVLSPALRLTVGS